MVKNVRRLLPFANQKHFKSHGRQIIVIKEYDFHMVGNIVFLAMVGQRALRSTTFGLFFEYADFKVRRNDQLVFSHFDEQICCTIRKIRNIRLSFIIKEYKVSFERMCTIITGELKYKKIYVRRILRVFNDEPKIDYIAVAVPCTPRGNLTEMGTISGRTDSNRGVQWYEGKTRDVPLALLPAHMHDM
ncbi:hypothetical protein PGB90_003246 [Kerria lacca]